LDISQYMVLNVVVNEYIRNMFVIPTSNALWWL